MGEVRARIAANLKACRKRAGMSVQTVGDALGKSGKTISAWEVGRGQPDADDVVAVCRLFGIDIADLYGTADDYGETRLRDIYKHVSEEGRTALLACAEGIFDAYGDVS